MEIISPNIKIEIINIINIYKEIMYMDLMIDVIKYVTNIYYFNKRPTGPKGHLSIRNSTLTYCQKGSYLHITSPIME